MRKISERLTKLGQTERSGFGFGARAANTKIPVILIGAKVDSPAQAKNLGADLIILAADSTGSPQTKAVDGTEISGVSALIYNASSLAKADMIALRESINLNLKNRSRLSERYCHKLVSPDRRKPK